MVKAEGVHQYRCVSNFRGQWCVGGPNTKAMGLIAPSHQIVLKDQMHKTVSRALLTPPLYTSLKPQTLESHPLVRCLVVFLKRLGRYARSEGD